MANLLYHSAERAVIELNQHELLLVMAFVQASRDSCARHNNLGRSVDKFFVSANVLVEQARRDCLHSERQESSVDAIHQQSNISTSIRH